MVAGDRGLGGGSIAEEHEGTFWMLEMFCISTVVLEVIHLYATAKTQHTILGMSICMDITLK